MKRVRKTLKIIIFLRKKIIIIILKRHKRVQLSFYELTGTITKFSPESTKSHIFL